MTTKTKERLGSLAQIFTVLLVTFASMFLITHFVISRDVVQGVSMEPTLHTGDRLVSLKHKTIKRNDIVVLKAPDKPGELYIKRVIGLPGDTVAVQDDQLFINGKKVDQPYLKASFMKQEIKRDVANGTLAEAPPDFTNNFTLATQASTNRESVPANHYFVMGDNRVRSHDGRDFGFVSRQQIDSVVVWRYWPINQMKIY